MLAYPAQAAGNELAGGFNQEEVHMKKIVICLSILVFISVFGYGSALAANPDKIKVGILLPLTGTVCGGG